MAAALSSAQSVRNNHSYRIASIGDKSAAFFAGNTPKIIPIPEDTPSASNTEFKSIYAGNHC